MASITLFHTHVRIAGNCFTERMSAALRNIHKEYEHMRLLADTRQCMQFMASHDRGLQLMHDLLLAGIFMEDGDLVTVTANSSSWTHPLTQVQSNNFVGGIIVSHACKAARSVYATATLSIGALTSDIKRPDDVDEELQWTAQFPHAQALNTLKDTHSYIDQWQVALDASVKMMCRRVNWKHDSTLSDGIAFVQCIVDSLRVLLQVTAAQVYRTSATMLPLDRVDHIAACLAFAADVMTETIQPVFTTTAEKSGLIRCKHTHKWIRWQSDRAFEDHCEQTMKYHAAAELCDDADRRKVYGRLASDDTTPVDTATEQDVRQWFADTYHCTLAARDFPQSHTTLSHSDLVLRLIESS